MDAVMNQTAISLPLEIALMDRMGCTYQELMATPNHIVEDYLNILRAQAEGGATRDRWKK